MEEEDTPQTNEADLFGIGERLRRAREAAGLTIEDVAAQTRISVRHLHDIERGDFAALPGRTYAFGFSRTYARTVGLDEGEVADAVRAELDAATDYDRPMAAKFEPGDPARVPSGGLVWFSIIAILLLLIGGYFFFRPAFSPGGELPPLTDDTVQADEGQGAATTDAVATDGPVVFTSTDDAVWVKFYDRNGTQLMQKEMARGESYTVPADADGPLLWTGRPDALTITIGGREMPRLAEDQQVMRDVAVSPAELLARLQPEAQPAADAGDEAPAPANATATTAAPAPSTAPAPAPQSSPAPRPAVAAPPPANRVPATSAAAQPAPAPAPAPAEASPAPAQEEEAEATLQPATAQESDAGGEISTE